MKLGDRIANLRKQKSISLPQLAQRAGISKSYLWAIEKGEEEANPSIEILFKVAEGLETTVADLLGEEGVKPRTSISKIEPELEKLIEERRRAGKPIPEDRILAMTQIKTRRKGKKITKEDWSLFYQLIDKVLGGEES